MATSVVTGRVIDGAGNPVENVPVSATLEGGPGFRKDDSSQVFDPPDVTTDAAGNWSHTLERQGNISPDTTAWRIVVVRDTQQDSFLIYVPDLPSVEARTCVISAVQTIVGHKAGGVLDGNYPDPTFATPQASQGDLDAEEAARIAADSAEMAARIAADSAETAARAASDAAEAAARAVHAAATSGVHGIADTAHLVSDDDARLSDQRNPTVHHLTHQPGGTDALDLTKFEIITTTAGLAAITPFPAAGVRALVTDENGGTPYVSNGSVWLQAGAAVNVTGGGGGPPSGAAGGVLGGNYPNPGFASDMATQAELDAHQADTTSIHGIPDTAALVKTTDTGTVTDGMVAAANKDGADATPSLRTLGDGVGKAASGAAYADHVDGTDPDPHDSLYYLTALMEDPVSGHLNIADPNGWAHAANQILVAAITGFGAGSLQTILAGLAAAIPAGSSAFEQDEPVSFPDTLSVQNGKAKYLARVAEDILGVRATVDTAATTQDVTFAAKVEGADIFPVNPGLRNGTWSTTPNVAGTVITCIRPTNVAGDRLQLVLATQADDTANPTPPSGFGTVPFGSPLAPGANVVSSRPRALDWTKVSAGLEGTARTVTDAVTNGTTTLTSATAAFVAGDQGKSIRGTNIGPSTTIQSVTNGTTVVLSQAATGSGSGGSITINDSYVLSGLTAGRPYVFLAASWKDSETVSIPSAGFSGVSSVTDLNGSLVGSITVGGAPVTQKNSLQVAVVVANGSGASNPFGTPAGWTGATGAAHASGLSATILYKVAPAVGVSSGCGPVTGSNAYWIGQQLILRTNRPYIAAGQLQTAAEFVPSAAQPQVAVGQKWRVDVEQIGPAGNEGKDLTVWVRRRPH